MGAHVSVQSVAYRLGVCAEMVFTDLPILERVKRIHSRGFEVEIWDWQSKDLDALAATGATFSSMTGYLEGDLTTDEGVDALLTTARASLEAAAVIDCPRLNLHGTGLAPGGLPARANPHPTHSNWLRAADTLRKVAELGEEAGRVFTLENLNLDVDHPGVPFARAEDTLALVSHVNSPGLRLNLDLYHAQIGEGNLIELIRTCLPWIGEIQVADVPGRLEPGTGEIRYSAIATELRAVEYDGVVALEGWASGDPDAALDRFERVFTHVAASGA